MKMTSMTAIGLCSTLLWAVLGSAAIAADGAAPGSKISFKKVQIDTAFRAEGVAVADFNGDGKLDIAAGNVYYAAPDWKMHPIREKPASFPPRGYSDCFACFADDLNGDGRPDLIVVDMPGKSTCWYENPGKPGGPWKKHLMVTVTNNESPLYEDVDGDGHRELVFGYSPDPKQPDGPERRMAIAKPGKDPYQPWEIHTISAAGGAGSKKYSHGMGVGDLNGDGRNDVLVSEGWYEQPADKHQTPWSFHPANFGPDCAQMMVFDFAGNGHNSVLTSSAHRYGVWWHEPSADGWKSQTIDQSISQTHAVCLADLNGDGLPDIVSGKRWWAHIHGDPGIDEPALLVWYQLSRSGGRPAWTRHVIDSDSGVGTQFQVVDVNGDGLLDIVVSNKKGVFYFQQVRE